MRGAPARNPQGALLHRIIPADAGSTWPRFARPHTTRDHPRGCREHWSTSPTWILLGGSSPRMRGAHYHRLRTSDPSGIIPADAGSTARRGRLRAYDADHPRGCGEHDGQQRFPRQPQGSSPRMRGAHRCGSSAYACHRIIPADAGSTNGIELQPEHARDHPRGCGEHRQESPLYKTRTGSSPRMRGALTLCVPLGTRTRIIPADAGSTLSSLCTPCCRGDHPRGCGEHIQGTGES